MKLLFFTPSPESYMRAPLLAEDQVICGPDYVDGKTASGLPCYKTPLGSFDAASFIQGLGVNPDLVVCLVDASWRCVPTGLKKLRCPCVLLVADTHHLHRPISQMVDYARGENFDHVVILYDRHHALFFKAAGIEKLHWLPGLTFPYDDSQIASAPSANRRNVVALYGQISRIHPRRRRLLEAMAGAHIPLAVQTGPQAGCLPFYGRALVGFNASLNGDLNLRVFEILASGAALLTDRLGAESGLERLLTNRRDCLLYDDASSLISEAMHLLQCPREAQEIGASGRKWLSECYNEPTRRALFHQIIQGEKLPDEFLLKDLPSINLPPLGSSDWKLHLQCYEEVQELHRRQESVSLVVDATLKTLWEPLLRTLPRLNWAASSGDFVISELSSPVPHLSYERHCPDLPELGSIRHESGASVEFSYAPPEPENRSQESAQEAPLQRIRQLIRNAHLGPAFEQARQLMESGHEQASCLLLIGEIALLSGKIPLAHKLISDAKARQASPMECARLEQALTPTSLHRGSATLLEQQARALLKFHYNEKLISLCSRMLAQNPGEACATRCLILVYSRLSQHESCLKHFANVRRDRSTEDTELALAAATACARLGKIPEAIALLQEAAKNSSFRQQALSDLIELQISLGRWADARRSLKDLGSTPDAQGRFLLLHEWLNTSLGTKS